MKEREINNKGITLIILVITIIILLILAGVVLSLSFGKNGVMKVAEKASEETIRQEAIEKINLKITDVYLIPYAETQQMPTLQKIADEFCEDEEIQYVEFKNKSFFTKLKEYPYEFEIGENFQIISIDGTKVEGNISNNVGNQGNNTSNVISDFNPIVTFNNGIYLELTNDANTNDGSEIVTYLYILNGKVCKQTDKKEVTIDNLEMETDYNLQILAVDENAKTKYSSILKVKTSNKLYLYKEGKQCNQITGGWRKTGYHSSDLGTIKLNDDNMYIYAPNGSRIFIGTTNMIDLTDYSKLFIEEPVAGYVLCQISKVAYHYNNYGSDQRYCESLKGIDISNYNDRYYIHFTNANDASSTIKNVWIEK